MECIKSSESKILGYVASSVSDMLNSSQQVVEDFNYVRDNESQLDSLRRSARQVPRRIGAFLNKVDFEPMISTVVLLNHAEHDPTQDVEDVGMITVFDMSGSVDCSLPNYLGGVKRNLSVSDVDWERVEDTSWKGRTTFFNKYNSDPVDVQLLHVSNLLKRKEVKDDLLKKVRKLRLLTAPQLLPGNV